MDIDTVYSPITTAATQPTTIDDNTNHEAWCVLKTRVMKVWMPMTTMKYAVANSPIWLNTPVYTVSTQDTADITA